MGGGDGKMKKKRKKNRVLMAGGEGIYTRSKNKISLERSRSPRLVRGRRVGSLVFEV